MQVWHRRGPSVVAPSRRREEGGETLVELLVTIVVMGFAVAALISGLFTTSATAHTNKIHTQASIALQAWAEDLQQPAIAIPAVTSPNFSPYRYVPCATTQYGGPPTALPPGFTASITSIRYLTGFSGGVPNFSATCPSPDKGIQEITLKIQADGNVDTLVVYRRDQSCPTAYDNADLGPC